MKKLTALFLTIAVVISLSITALAAPPVGSFTDLPADHWAFAEVSNLSLRNVISGYEDGSFRPNNAVTRAEWAKMMIGAAGLQANDYNVRFYDMVGHWAMQFVNAARDYLTAYDDGSFRPNQEAIREDVTAAMVRIKGYDISEADFSHLEIFTDPDSITDDAKAYVAIAVEYGLISGFDDNTFRGQDTVTRAQAAVMLWRAFPTGPVITTPESSELPAGGGSVRVNGETEYPFTPESTGLWEIYTSENGAGDPFLSIYDDSGNLLAEDDDSAGSGNARILIFLEAGVTYTVRAGFFGTSIGSYTLYVMPRGGNASIPGGGGDIRVSGAKDYLFCPDRSGIWVIKTLDAVYVSTILEIYGADGSIISRGSSWNSNVTLVAYLEAGEDYFVYAEASYGSYYGSPTMFTLSIAPITTSASLPRGGGKTHVSETEFYELRPNRTGLWTFTASDYGDVDPFLRIYNSNGGIVTSGWWDDVDIIVAYLEAGETYYVYIGASYSYYGESIEFDMTFAPMSVSATIPRSGGEINVRGMSFYEFRPNNTGAWIFKTSDSGESIPELRIYDDRGNILAWTAGYYDDSYAMIGIILEEGETYYIFAGFYDGSSGSYTLSVAPPESLPTSGGETRVVGDTVYLFTPDRTGVWEFRTSSVGNNDPMVAIYDNEGYFIDYNDDGALGWDVLLSVYLEAGETYIVDVWFWNYDGVTTMRVTYRGTTKGVVPYSDAVSE